MPQNIGEFFGNFAQSFQQTQASQKEQKRLDEMAKLQGKLLELQLNAKQGQLDAQTTVSDMMSGVTRTPEGNPLQNINLGTPGEPVPETTGGMGAQELINDPEGLSALLASGQLEGLLDLSQEQRLQGQADQNAEMMNKFLSGDMFGGGFGPDDPYTPVPTIGSDGSFSMQLVPNENFQTQVLRDTTTDNVSVMFRDVTKAMGLLGEIEGTHLQAGNPLGDLLRKGGEAGSAFGLPFFTGEDQEVLRDKRGELGKLLASFQITSEERKALSQTARGQQVLALVEQASASLENGGIPNGKILLNMLRAKIQAAKVLGNEIPNEDRILNYIDETQKILDQGTMPGGKAALSDEQIASQVTPESVSQMGAEALDWMHQALQGGMTVSQDVIKALQERERELNSVE